MPKPPALSRYSSGLQKSLDVDCGCIYFPFRRRTEESGWSKWKRGGSAMKKWMGLFLFLILAYAENAHREIVAKAVPYTHNNVKLEGYLAYDDST